MATYPPRAHNPLMEAEQRAMLDLLPSLDGQIVLDLASGTGRYGILAEGDGARQVVEIDNSAAMLRANPLSYRAQATSEALPLKSKSVDVVLCALALGHLPRLEPSMREIARVLKRDGIALISDFHPFLCLNGARRTFTTEGQTYAVEHYPHLYGDYHRAAINVGLRIEQVAEPRLEAQPEVPLVIVFRLRKAD